MDWRVEEERLREFFGLGSEVELLDITATKPEVTPEVGGHLAEFNLEWHIIPSASAVPFDKRYVEKLYPARSRDFERVTHLRPRSYMDVLASGHRRHQGRVLAVEATRKPRYLPGNRQYYGTTYGFDSTADPFAQYIGRAGLLTGTRYAHNYISLREFVDVVNRDWRDRRLMPAGYRLTICPPAVFNLIGTVFHPEWSETETLELGFYRDDHGNATCYAVGSNAPGDFSYIHEVETDSDWTLLGFRTALVPV
ncbi:MAG TPA: hypothetical protein VNO14_13175 [Blastocatellia bacterium]|nr:hypothetical protein [Blastocatellia bacterium]